MAVTIDGSANTITATATSAVNAIGVGQTWQQFTVPAQRASGATNTNDTGRPIFISVRLDQDDGQISLRVSGLVIASSGTTAGPQNYTVSAIIPAGATYVITSSGTSGTSLFWYELR